MRAIQKRCLALLMIVGLLVESIFNMPVVTEAAETGTVSSLWDGEGTEESPYLIKTADDMRRLVEARDVWQYNGGSWKIPYFRLEADIDLGGEANPWTPIGKRSWGFSGSFDGNRHAIRGLYINAKSGDESQGLFAEIGQGGRVENLTVYGNISVESGSQAQNIGSIAGGNRGTITNCVSYCEVSGTGYVGGITGEIVFGGIITNCENRGEIHPSDGKTVAGTLGGIVGEAVIEEGRIENCRNYGEVRDGLYIGGIIGYGAGEIVISNCANYGKLSGENCIGGIAGRSQELNGDENAEHPFIGVIQDCVNEAEIISNGAVAGGIVGDNDVNNVVGCLNRGDIICSGNCERGGIAGMNYGGGKITECFNYGMIQGDEAFIGGIAARNTGEIIRSANHGDLTGKVVGGIAASVFSVRQSTDVDTIKVYKAKVEDCYNDATLTTTQTAAKDIGGISAWCSGWKDNAGIVTGDLNNCYNAGAVVGSDGKMIGGGLSGQSSNAVISNCYYQKGTGQKDVYSPSNSQIDDKALSISEFAMRSSFSSWDFTSVWKMGTARPVLLAGTDTGDTIPDISGIPSREEEEPETVAVTGISLSRTSLTLSVGETATLTATIKPTNASNKNIIWSSNETSVATVSDGVVTGVSGGTAIITAKAEDGNYSAKCAVTVETEAEAIWSGEGTKEAPYLIKTASDLVNLAERVNQNYESFQGTYFRMTKNIDLSAVCGEQLSGGTSWTPIGSDAVSEGLSFAGIFDGNEKEITGLYIYGNGEKALGLFGSLNGTVQNLTVSGKIVLTNAQSGYVGGIVGVTEWDDQIRVENCVNRVTIEGSANQSEGIGGVVGCLSRGQVKNCRNEAKIVGTTRTGGVVGYGVGGISDSENSGNVTGTEFVGGIAGEGYSIRNCQNKGTITGTGESGEVGGIVGHGRKLVSGCKNSGKVFGNESGTDVGGIAGAFFYGLDEILSDCENTGTVTGSDSVGGIIGSNMGVCRNCENHGEVTSKSEAGGIAGSNGGIIEKSSNSGKIIGLIWAGGIIGSNFAVDFSSDGDEGGILRNCYNIGTVSAQKREDYELTGCIHGGLIGISSYGAIENCYNAGMIEESEGASIGALCGAYANSYDEATAQYVSHQGTISASYYLLNGILSGVPELENDNDERGLSADAFAVQSNFVGWDFDTIWKMGTARPVLQSGTDSGALLSKSSSDNSEGASLVVKQSVDLTDYFDQKYQKYTVMPKGSASISKKGVLKVKKSGTITVTAYAKNGKTWEPKGEVSLTAIKPSFSTKSIPATYIGQKIDVSEFLISEGAAPTAWTSSKTKIASIDEEGMITVAAKGTSTLTAVYGVGKNAAKYSVSLKVAIPKLSKSKVKMQTGATVKLKLKNTKKTVRWDCEDSDETASVNQNGVVTALSAGKTSVIATVDGKDYVCELEVVAPTMKKSTLSVKVGKTGRVGLKNTKLKNVTWKSDDETVATVDATGKVKGISKGTAIIYTDAGGTFNSCVVTVK